MKPWHNVVVPHRDIREGHFEGGFAASLADVAKQRGAAEYWDGPTFFTKTYPTRGLLKLLAAVAGRLAGTIHGEGVIQLQTPFGGGKTHALLALYHLFQGTPVDARLTAQILAEARATNLPTARVITFDGTEAGSLGGGTPWGEIARQAGRYDIMAEYDQRHRSPGKELLHQVLGNEPTLILMDEIAEYAAKARDFREQVVTFCQDLSMTANVLPRCALVVTLPASAPYGEEGERALHELQMVFGRVEAIYTPVEGTEVYEIIRRRLFEDLGSEEDARQAVEEYWQMYQRLGEDVPDEVRQPEYRERMRRAYPFHPQVIDVLHERWGTFPTFQRTRGALRVLAHVVADLYRKEHASPLIQAAHINLTNTQIQREFLKHIGNEFESVIATDIADSNAKAQHIDQEMGTEYARFNVASGLATAIFFGSFSGSERRGINLPALRLALLREGIPPAIVGDALTRLKSELWFLYEDNGFYHFRNQANLNRAIMEREEAVEDKDIAAEIRTRVGKMAGTEMRVTTEPRVPGDVPDSRELKLAVLGGEYTERNPATPRFVEQLLNRDNVGGFRTLRNTLLVLVPNGAEYAALRAQVRRTLGLRSIVADKSLWATLTPADKDTVEGKLKDAEGGLDWQLLTTYRHLARASSEDIAWLDMGLPTAGDKGSLAKRVRDFLKGQDILLSKLAPRHIIEKAFGKDDQQKRLGDVWEAFLRYPHLPLLETESVLRRSIVDGVQSGALGVRIGDKVYYKDTLAETALDDETLVLRPEVAEAEKLRQVAATDTGKREVKDGGIITDVVPPTDKQVQPPVSPKEVTRLTLRVRVPWDRMSDLVRGVLLPLRSDEASLQVEVSVSAESAKGIKKATLEQKVDETLRQIGAEVIEERRE